MGKKERINKWTVVGGDEKNIQFNKLRRRAGVRINILNLNSEKSFSGGRWECEKQIDIWSMSMACENNSKTPPQQINYDLQGKLKSYQSRNFIVNDDTKRFEWRRKTMQSPRRKKKRTEPVVKICNCDPLSSFLLPSTRFQLCLKVDKEKKREEWILTWKTVIFDHCFTLETLGWLNGDRSC